MSVAQLLSPPEAPVAGASWMDLAACKGHTPLFFRFSASEGWVMVRG